MPTPRERLLASEQVTDKIIRERLLEAYREIFERYKKDLKSRLDRYHVGAVWGGSDNPAIKAAMLDKLLVGLQKRMGELDTAFFKAMDGKLDESFLRGADRFIEHMAQKAPAWVGASAPLADKWKAYIRKGTLVEQKLLEGAYKAGGIHSQHALLFEKTRAVLHANLNSGRSYWEIFTDIEKRVWGLDYTKTGANQGVMAWIKRLIRTEYQQAHNSARFDRAQAEPGIIGFTLLLDPQACPVCISAYGARNYFFDRKHGPTMSESEIPPSGSHPNCHCTYGGDIWQTLDGNAPKLPKAEFSS